MANQFVNAAQNALLQQQEQAFAKVSKSVDELGNQVAKQNQQDLISFENEMYKTLTTESENFKEDAVGFEAVLKQQMDLIDKNKDLAFGVKEELKRRTDKVGFTYLNNINKNVSKIQEKKREEELKFNLVVTEDTGLKFAQNNDFESASNNWNELNDLYIQSGISDKEIEFRKEKYFEKITFENYKTIALEQEEIFENVTTPESKEYMEKVYNDIEMEINDNEVLTEQIKSGLINSFKKQKDQSLIKYEAIRQNNINNMSGQIKSFSMFAGLGKEIPAGLEETIKENGRKLGIEDYVTNQIEEVKNTQQFFARLSLDQQNEIIVNTQDPEQKLLLVNVANKVKEERTKDPIGFYQEQGNSIVSKLGEENFTELRKQEVLAIEESTGMKIHSSQILNKQEEEQIKNIFKYGEPADKMYAFNTLTSLLGNAINDQDLEKYTGKEDLGLYKNVQLNNQAGYKDQLEQLTVGYELSKLYKPKGDSNFNKKTQQLVFSSDGLFSGEGINETFANPKVRENVLLEVDSIMAFRVQKMLNEGNITGEISDFYNGDDGIALYKEVLDEVKSKHSFTINKDSNAWYNNIGIGGNKLVVPKIHAQQEINPVEQLKVLPSDFLSSNINIRSAAITDENNPLYTSKKIGRINFSTNTINERINNGEYKLSFNEYQGQNWYTILDENNEALPSGLIDDNGKKIPFMYIPPIENKTQSSIRKISIQEKTRQDLVQGISIEEINNLFKSK